MSNNIQKKQDTKKSGILSGKNFFFIVIISISLTILEMLGQSILRKFFLLNKDKKPSGYSYIYLPLISWIIYGLCLILLFISYKYGDITLIEILWDTGTTLLVPIVGILLFNEGLTFYGYI